MKLDKAIEILEQQHHQYLTLRLPELTSALGLLIEAGRRIQHGRLLRNRYCIKKLPGETVE